LSVISGVGAQYRPIFGRRHAAAQTGWRPADGRERMSQGKTDLTADKRRLYIQKPLRLRTSAFRPCELPPRRNDRQGKLDFNRQGAEDARGNRNWTAKTPRPPRIFTKNQKAP